MHNTCLIVEERRRRKRDNFKLLVYPGSAGEGEDRGMCCKQKKKEGNKAGEDLPGSRWLRESLSSPGMEGGNEIRVERGEKWGKEIKGC